ncbi:hypothetical protein PCASD_13269 [Puccinia coronata f. sp. avenae]|uniref:Uncharacterized protein n=1 Tax=Puccinia coronata f. sp. avenae TaxID=200324 RepID=A0A2N5T3G7_9BASI|nr:hypothetical protein PCASD_13269 [Puccinia coronata f. sp. avenae]
MSTLESLTGILLSTFDTLLLAEDEQKSTEALTLIRVLLIGASLGGKEAERGTQFIQLQHRVELNASLVLLRFIAQLSAAPEIADALQYPASTDRAHISPILQQLATSFVLLQGLLHLHPPSQHLFASEYNLRILLRFLPPALHSSHFASIGLPLLDLLLITFVDSPKNAQLFESAGALEILIQAMKQKSLKTELRVKVIETLWAWWSDEEEPDPDQLAIQPTTQPNHPPHIHPISIYNPPRPKSSDVKLDHDPARTPSNHKTRGNSRIRPISLPPPSLPEEDEEEDNVANTSANLSDGHETPKPNRATTRVKIQPSSNNMSTSHSNPTKPQPFSSPMVKSSSEGTNGTPLRAFKPAADPASRLRLMLESTAGQFIPATPHHPHRTRPFNTPTHQRSSSPSPTPHTALLHKSHPVVSLKKPAQSDSSDSNPARPSDESDDSDRTDLSPHQLFPVRQRRTAIKQGSNTPQRLIRHKQSASLGSIQHTPTSYSRSRQSSEEEEAAAERGAEQDGRRHGSSGPSDERRARDPTRRSIRSSTLIASEPATPRSPAIIAATDTAQSRPSSRQTDARPLSPSELKRLSGDTPRASRTSKTPSRGSVGSKALVPCSPTLPSGLSSSQDWAQYTPKRSSGGASASAAATKSGRSGKTLITPATPQSHTSKAPHVLTGHPLAYSPNKRFISRPLTPNHSLVNQSDLELMVNGTDSDVGPSLALLSAKKERPAGKRRSVASKKPAAGDCQQDAAGRDLPVEEPPAAAALSSSLSPSPSSPSSTATPAPPKKSAGSRLGKTGILEKYMANSDELVRSFREIGVGFKALSRHHHPHFAPLPNLLRHDPTLPTHKHSDRLHR